MGPDRCHGNNVGAMVCPGEWVCGPLSWRQRRGDSLESFVWFWEQNVGRECIILTKPSYFSKSFSWQIFLNFFGAIILDNLEYSEEEKKKKLEVCMTRGVCACVCEQ